MEPMTNQEIFDKVAKTLIKQGKPCFISNAAGGLCSYYKPNGDRCAIGWLVDETTAKWLEEKYSGIGVSDISDEVLKDIFGEGYDLVLLTELQDVHDSHTREKPSEWLMLWKKAMTVIAEDYDLSTDVLFSN